MNERAQRNEAGTETTSTTTYTPDSEQAAAELLRELHQEGRTLAIAGNGSKRQWGGPLEPVDAVIATCGIRHPVVHDQADLVASAPAGMSWLQLQATLAQQGQWVAVNPPYAERASVGGVVASASAGAERFAYGALRDLVIGARALLASGEPIKAGGRVIKNVAGYDLCKLLVGSFGSLALLTDVTFKVAPLPETLGFFSGSAADAATLFHFGLLVRRSMLQPTAIQAFWPREGGEPRLSVTLHGFRPVVERQLRELSALAAATLHHPETIGPEPVSDVRQLQQDHGPAWPEAEAGVILLRVGTPAAETATAFNQTAQALAAFNARPLRADLGSGLCWWLIDTAERDAEDPSNKESATNLADRLAALNAALRALDGYATIQAGPTALRRHVRFDSDQIRLSARIKRLFDPDARLNPGSFV